MHLRRKRGDVSSTYLDTAVLSSPDLSTTDPQSKLELARCIAEQRRKGRDSLADTDNATNSTNLK